MSLNLVAFLVGLFVVPVALLSLGHRLRRRSARAQRAFWGAMVGHITAAILAVTVGMIPPETWTSSETLRGFGGFWALFVFPVFGGAYGLLRGRS